jgi:tetratricopeptide (TPR) repeat protein
MLRRYSSVVSRIGAGALTLGLAVALTACQHVPREDHSTGNPDERLALVLERLDMAREVGPNNNTVMQHESVIVDPGTVKADLENLSFAFPKHQPTLLMNANLAFEAKEYEKAAAYCDRILRDQPDNVFAGIIRAQIALQDGNVPFARRVLQRQLDLAPESPFLYEVLAGVEFLDGRLAESEAALHYSEALGGSAWRIAYHRGLIAERRGDRMGAAGYFRHCLDLKPDHEPARAHLTLLEHGPVPLTGPAKK